MTETDRHQQGYNLLAFGAAFRMVARFGRERGLSGPETLRALRVVVRKLCEPVELDGAFYAHLLALERAGGNVGELFTAMDESGERWMCEGADLLEGK